MPKSRTEEQFPLLVVLVGDKEVSRENRRFFGRGRLDGITSGATAIITEWPNYISTCWLSAFVCCLTLFALSILLASCLTYNQQPPLPRCPSSENHLPSNKTIHLVHTTYKWYPYQLDFIKNITKAFPNYQIHIIHIKNRLPKSKLILAALKIAKISSNNTANGTKTTQKLNKTIDNSLTNITGKFPNVVVHETTFKDFFENTPLLYNWISLNHQAKIFAIRVLQMWQHGGLTYDTLDYKIPFSKRMKNYTTPSMLKVQNYIQSGLKRFEQLQPLMVSVDPSGLHMECSTPCHAFFGSLLRKLLYANERSNPKKMLYGSMLRFCRNGVIDKEFCDLRHVFL